MIRKYYYKSANLTLSNDNGKYYKNDNELTVEGEEGEYTESKFDDEIKSAVSGWVNNRFDNIVCLIGAGASVVSGETGYPDENYGQTVYMIAKRVLIAIKEGKYAYKSDNGDVDNLDVYTLQELIDKIQYKENVTEGDENSEEIIEDFIDEEEQLSGKFNLENFLSVLLAYQKFVPKDDKDKLNNSIAAIFKEIIDATSYDYSTEKFKHGKFLNLLSKLTRKEQKLNIVTTNYDTLIEDAANKEGFTVLDGFKFAQSPIFDASMFDWHLIKEIPNVKTQEVEYMSKVINLLKIHGSLTWELSPTEKSILRKSKSTVKNPIMVFPSSDKYAQSYQEPYFELFTKFQELLKRGNTLLITSGFSFADNHISRMILQAIKSNVSLHVLVTDFDIEPEKPNENWKELGNMRERGYQIAFLQATMNGKLTNYLGEKND